MMRIRLPALLRHLPLRAALALLSAAPLTAPLPAHAATRTAYVHHVGDASTAWLVDWQAGHRAHAVASAGMGDGSWTDNGAGQRLVTFDAPITHEQQGVDCHGAFFPQRVEPRQVVFRPAGGTPRKGATQVVEIGQVVDEGGCTPGAVVPFGAPGDPGEAFDHLVMTARPSMADVLGGAPLAGFSETFLSDPVDVTPLWQDTVRIGAGDVTFATSGDVVGALLVDGWVVINLTGQQRAYTRISQDARTGAEVWLAATWSAGAPRNVWRTLMVQPRAGAGFGTAGQAARHWESGLFMGGNGPFWIDLYQDFTGLRIQDDLAAGTETTQPITWRFDGLKILQDRTTGDGLRERTWVPLANRGKTHWVMESETLSAAGGTSVVIAPRVNSYTDEGVAVKRFAGPQGKPSGGVARSRPGRPGA